MSKKYFKELQNIANQETLDKVYENIFNSLDNKSGQGSPAVKNRFERILSIADVVTDCIGIKEFAKMSYERFINLSYFEEFSKNVMDNAIATLYIKSCEEQNIKPLRTKKKNHNGYKPITYSTSEDITINPINPAEY